MINNIKVLNHGSVELIAHGGSDLQIVNAARVSYGKERSFISIDDQNLLKFLVKEGHESPFEHTRFTWRIKAPIFVARQWFRHRIASYNEISLRYTEAKPEFYIPQSDINGESGYEFNTRDFIQAQYQMANENAYLSYKQILKLYIKKGLHPKRARELARTVLPLGTYTEFIFTCNMRALQHFIKLRSDSHAQPEIQVYANAMKDIICSIADFAHTNVAYGILTL